MKRFQAKASAVLDGSIPFHFPIKSSSSIKLNFIPVLVLSNLKSTALIDDNEKLHFDILAFALYMMEQSHCCSTFMISRDNYISIQSVCSVCLIQFQYLIHKMIFNTVFCMYSHIWLTHSAIKLNFILVSLHYAFIMTLCETRIVPVCWMCVTVCKFISFF